MTRDQAVSLAKLLNDTHTQPYQIGGGNAWDGQPLNRGNIRVSWSIALVQDSDYTKGMHPVWGIRWIDATWTWLPFSHESVGWATP